MRPPSPRSSTTPGRAHRPAMPSFGVRRTREPGADFCTTTEGRMRCPPQFPPELLSTFRAMAEIVYSGESFDSVYDAVCSSAVQLVDGCDHASLMLQRSGRVADRGGLRRGRPSHRRAREVARRGPLPRRHRRQRARPAHLLRPHHRQQVARAGAQDPGRDTTSAAWPGSGCARTGQRVGALNVFSDTAGALTSHSLDQAVMLTAFASVTLAAARAWRGGRPRCGAAWRATARSARRSAC